MISRIRGKLLEKNPPQLLVEVQGIAYELDAPMFSFYRLPMIGEEVVLFTHFVVREDAQLLYGFTAEKERSLFRNLIKVSAIGPKLALAILSGMEAESFVDCVLKNDVASLVRIPGVGKKTAERLVIEMRDRLGDWQTSVSPQLNTSENPVNQEAISALVALGYKPNEARTAVNQIADEHQSSEELIRHALRNMVTGVRHASRTSN